MFRHVRPTTGKGFTLIELLIVIAIVLILIAIALPNFLEAQIRAKVARAESDMRTLAIAMESYYVDRKIYPYASVSSLDYTHLTDGFRWLTSPIPYITTLPIDPFSLPIETSTVLPYRGPNYKLVSTTPIPLGLPRTNNVDAYFIYSFGPNYDDESTYGGQFWPFSQLENPCEYLNSTNLKTYSPTNGTRSAGDILRFGGEFRAGNWCLDGVIIRGRNSGV